MAPTPDELPHRLDVQLSSPVNSSALHGGANIASLARPWWRTTATRVRERRAARQDRPFPPLGRRIRSAVGLVVLVGVLGCVVAALVGAVLVAIVIVGNHLVG